MEFHLQHHLEQRESRRSRERGFSVLGALEDFSKTSEKRGTIHPCLSLKNDHDISSTPSFVASRAREAECAQERGVMFLPGQRAPCSPARGDEPTHPPGAGAAGPSAWGRDLGKCQGSPGWVSLGLPGHPPTAATSSVPSSVPSSSLAGSGTRPALPLRAISLLHLSSIPLLVVCSLRATACLAWLCPRASLATDNFPASIIFVRKTAGSKHRAKHLAQPDRCYPSGKTILKPQLLVLLPALLT